MHFIMSSYLNGRKNVHYTIIIMFKVKTASGLFLVVVVVSFSVLLLVRGKLIIGDF